jgi:hypothetical protein
MSEVGKALRYERKFFIEDLTFAQVLSLVKQHPCMFRELYPPRYINNFYFDTPHLAFYNANVDGDMIRAKMRIRWYHDLLQSVEKPILEVKYKDGIVGDKWSYPFPSFVVQSGFNMKDLQPLIRSGALEPDIQTTLAGMEISLLNRYYRYYFATPDQRFRLTIDTQLSYYRVEHFNNRFRHHYLDHNNLIVELKYQPEYDQEAQRISAFFPFRMTRSSKYVTGVELVYL